jgi:E3 ubiquitin-protein ligase MYCBP2
MLLLHEHMVSPQAYFGGEARCDAEAGQGDDYDPRELICGACSDVSRAQVGRR